MSHVTCFDASRALHHVTTKRMEERQNSTDNQHRKDSLNRYETFSLDTFAACYAWALLSSHVSTYSPDQAASRNRRLKNRS